MAMTTNDEKDKIELIFHTLNKVYYRIQSNWGKKGLRIITATYFFDSRSQL